jgi:3-oxoacyl-[acyl-carrier protein] reductase
MDINLSGKRAVVCGGSQGIGHAIAREFAEAGASVTIIARKEEALKEAVRSLKTDHNQLHDFLKADFNDPEGLKNILKQYLLREPSVHILVNNTGGPPAGPISDARTQDFESAFIQHLICNHILVQAFLPSMKGAGYGRIINIISTSVKQPLKGLGVSNTVRGAVASWSKTLAGEVAHFGITVNNVLPGATRTKRLSSLIGSKAERSGKTSAEIENEMLSEIPVGRFAEPHEIAAAVTFLASPSAAYITGINVPVDGGRTSSL